MSIIFQNPGLIDLRAIQIMGLNAKETKNPIGQFGTGLKYAIAVLLRSGCKVSVFRGKEEYIFITRKEDFRGKEFAFVYMVPTFGKEALDRKPLALGFTLELGKHWEPWMAIRELESNCRDENGQSFASADYQLSTNTTTIVISGPVAEVAYSLLPNIFITSRPLWQNADLEVHRVENPEQAKWLYYRGVRCQLLEKPALYRYNILSEIALTEDRTFKYPWLGDGAIQTLGECTNEDIIRKAVICEKGNFEWDIAYKEYQLSDKFCEIVSALSSRATVNAWGAVRLARGYAEFEEIEMDALQQQMLDRAQAFIERMGEKRIRAFPVFLTPDLGENKLGRALLSRKEI